MTIIKYLGSPAVQCMVPILALLVTVIGASTTVNAGQIEITALPATITTAMHTTAYTSGSHTKDTVTLAGTKLSATGNGLLFLATYGDRVCDYVLLLNNDTLEFGTDGNDNVIGITFDGTNAYYPKDIEILGGYIIHAPNDTIQGICKGVSGRGNNITFDGTYIEVHGDNYGHCMYITGQSVHSWEVKNCVFNNLVTAYTDRQQYGTCGILFNTIWGCNSVYDYDGSCDDFYHIKIHACSVLTTPHMGIAFVGREGHQIAAEVYDNYIYVDARNDMYTYQSANFSQGIGNSYAIIFRTASGGNIIRNNTIRSGTSYFGGRGILWEGQQDGVDESQTKIVSNDMEIWHGEDMWYGEHNPCYGIRIRYGSPGNLLIDSNTIRVFCDTTSTTYMGSIGYAVGLTATSADTITFEHNYFAAIGTSNQNIHAGAIGARNVVNAFNLGGNENFSTVVCRYNRYESTCDIFKIGEEGTAGGLNATSYADTFAYYDTTISPVVDASQKNTFAFGMYGTPNGTNTNIIDPVFLNSASETDLDFYTGAADVTFMRTLIISVKGNNDLPVSGTEVSVTNGDGDVVLIDTTSGSGTVVGLVAYRFESSDSGPFDYNDFTVKAKKGSDSTSTSFTVDATSPFPPPLFLPVEGTPDAIAPAAIDDLSATPGVENGIIYLSWTAPGNDCDVGIAATYDIRFSTGSITENNWSSATLFPNPPIPLLAGTPQSATITGLTPGSEYYVALKTSDENYNESDLSNVPLTEAYTSIIAGEDDDEQDQFAPALPVAGSTVNTRLPTLVVINFDQSSDNVYYFQVAADSGFSPLVASSQAVMQESGSTTVWTVEPELQASQLYFWRVRVNDVLYSDISYFTVEPRPHAYPNPFITGSTDEVVFTEIPDHANLILMTVSGDLVKRWADITGHEVRWNGTNESGNPVASGMYLWYIENSKMKGKLAVIR